jgi:hypothetical protein
LKVGLLSLCSTPPVRSISKRDSNVGVETSRNIGFAKVGSSDLSKHAIMTAV